MTSVLYICEKPSQARDIAKHLQATKKQEGYLEGNGNRVTWCLGHLLELAPPEYYRPDIRPWRIEKLPVIPMQWKMIVSSRTKKQFTIVKNLLKQTSHVVIASDPDRAGEAIVREILDYCHYEGKIERLWLSALDDVSIEKAMRMLKSSNATIALYEGEKSRAASDYLLGLNLSMAASSLYGVNGVLSLGRVQTPTLRLVVDRDTSIENFKSKAYFILKGLFKINQGRCFWANWKPNESLLDEGSYCTNQSYVESVAAKIEDEPGIITHCAQVLKKQKAPLCFSLSTLQKKASAQYGYGAKQVLDIVQSLYEKHKAVTYPRTDSGYLPEEQREEVNAVLKAVAKADNNIQALVKHCDLNFKSQVWNNKKVTAHHAIIPTLNESIDIGKMTAEELNLYDLIRRRYLVQFMGDYQYQATTIELQCAGEQFIATGNRPIHLGWKQALKMAGIAEDESLEIELPLLNKGDSVDNCETKLESHQTKPPARFTEGTLIEAMKTVGKFVDDDALKKVLKDSKGIGTEATRANIIEVLFKRGYLSRKDKQVVSTEKGRALLEIAPAKLKDPILTAQWEEKLEQIAQGKFTLDAFIDLQCEILYTMLNELKAGKEQHQRSVLQLQSETQNGKVYLCPLCQQPLRRLKNRKGRWFYGCSSYDKGCRFTTWEKQGKPTL